MKVPEARTQMLRSTAPLFVPLQFLGPVVSLALLLCTLLTPDQIDGRLQSFVRAQLDSSVQTIL